MEIWIQIKGFMKIPPNLAANKTSVCNLRVFVTHGVAAVEHRHFTCASGRRKAFSQGDRIGSFISSPNSRKVRRAATDNEVQSVSRKTTVPVYAHRAQ